MSAHWQKHFKAGPRTGRFAATTEGVVGWVPKDAREGDLVVLLYGSDMPFVLRRAEKRGGGKDRGSRDTTYYRLVGECYIQGIMAGEAMMTTASSNRSRQVGRSDVDREGRNVEDTRETTFALI